MKLLLKLIMYNIINKKITGRWYKSNYKIIRLIGNGGVGEIYLAAHEKRGLVALKISRSMLSITREYDNMKKCEGKKYLPMVYELDDFEIRGEAYHFFAMEYIDGYDLSKVMKSDLPLKLKLEIFIIILRIIEDINEEGLIYSDLKNENIMVDSRNLFIRLVDFGSLTPAGGIIKEYTPLYDRCSWNMGDRTADGTYQVFSAAVLLMTLILGYKLQPDKNNISSISKALAKNNTPETLADLIEKAFKGEIKNCRLFYEKLMNVDISVKKKDLKLNALLDSIIAILVFLLGVVLVNLKALTPISLF